MRCQIANTSILIYIFIIILIQERNNLRSLPDANIMERKLIKISEYGSVYIIQCTIRRCTHHSQSRSLALQKRHWYPDYYCSSLLLYLFRLLRVHKIFATISRTIGQFHSQVTTSELHPRENNQRVGFFCVRKAFFIHSVFVFLFEIFHFSKHKILIILLIVGFSFHFFLFIVILSHIK